VNTCSDLKGFSPEVDPLQIARPRRRCAHCYAAAGNRQQGQSVKRVSTSCGSCKKPRCLRHMHLVCQECHSSPVLQSRLEQISEEQKQQISRLTKQFERLHRELSRKSAAAQGMASLPFSCSQCTESFAQLTDLSLILKFTLFTDVPIAASPLIGLSD
jgi:hypothetical protein